MTPEEQSRFERIERLVEFLANNQAQISAQEDGKMAWASPMGIQYRAGAH